VKSAFTLAEIMIVVGILVLLAIFAIPNVLRARVNAQEAAAASSLRTIVNAQTQWKVANPAYTNLSQLGAASPPYLDSILGCAASPCIKQGYSFWINIDLARAKRYFFAVAQPQSMQVAHTFYIDEDGVLCRSDTVNTPAPGVHVDDGCPVGFSESQ